MWDKRFKRTEELPLGTFGSGKRLNIINEEQIEVAIALIELFKACVSLISRLTDGCRVFVNEILSRDAADFRLGM